MLQRVIKHLNHNLSKHDIAAQITGRIKHPISILYKLYRNGIKLEELTDIFVISIVVIDEEKCYKALKVVHDLYEYEKDKFKNYILNPKPNGYQSLHTIITTEDNYKIEIQIRDHKMHYHAESGEAAHWKYKNSF
ncbi:MAG: bifunctional (p)ppGpp synthetase/guanosine-3',5'-bis(diphosphate) 3'-pyrophosphohydrolase [Rickettsia conorii subsp. raoultii]|uniref:Bifunctional (P)ppGpp synthetase/guanosine-3',5'-bis(Diphosphate) 3'-pyrophosphohydrolase n=1 Tax=Rickettsia conorii subsp. raoultii TaxID=369822 RepID=A0ABY4TZG1_RICCR|nr:bifunctional (p)ppGpp synthetase/guanosine-3',5'-bis(diphosphate) 3'-pyrophosphohydrolase [Rickettsia conorii]URW77409.1 bifunctional (p)ppGpp synthetase/guanosine-3',5'-bis(diphosphate) 3'-pyrophosphohydrolase [Rickettsia conorii subsp. raoultii]